MTVQTIKATTLAQYLQSVAQITSDWSVDADEGECSPWFRGQKNANWDLTPGEYRFPTVDSDELRSDFILKAGELLRRLPSSHWDWYFIMQHFGLPTRLLDWTSGSLIGLHFALSQDTGVNDAAVWMLDPWALNEWSLNSSDLLLTSDSAARRFLMPPYASTSKMHSRPVAIVPPFNSARITVQRGTFTVHGTDRKPLNKLYQHRLRRILIPRISALEIRRDLRRCGISEFTVFPDLDGLSRDLRAQLIEGC